MYTYDFFIFLLYAVFWMHLEHSYKMEKYILGILPGYEIVSFKSILVEARGVK